ncbi:MAG TPA: PPOX class F420-dependent oxidoreductase [Thermodesulfobacteriota bacterium]|nr:PPOX class F420-dependent oxidoreductase [Thermodesulfobacteriota bacterium]
MKLDKFVYELCTEGKNFAAVSTLMPDGSPHVSVVWVDSDGEDILINTAEGRVKPENLRRDGRAAISIFDPQNPYRQAMVRGKAEEDKSIDAEKHIDKMAMKYMGVDKYPHGGPGEKRVVFRIKPEHVFKLT